MTVRECEGCRTMADLIKRMMIKGRCSSYAAGKELIYEELPKESAFQAAIIKYLKTVHGCFVWKEQAGPFQMGGLPDVMAIINGRLYGFEVKRPWLGKVSPLQLQTHLAMRKAGARVLVCSYVSEVKKVLQDDGILEVEQECKP